MKIDRLQIHGFGKYRNFTLQAGDGLNIIYGSNEAGKTTLQMFILAMLFGMKKAGKKRTVYSEEHTRYSPWQGEEYGGILTCTIDGQSYRIERNFLKHREACRIYRDLTGEDITLQFPEDSRKERMFLQTLLGIDELMFKNSLCLGDGLRLEWDEWRRETAPKLVSGSYLQTADQTLIQKAEAVLVSTLEEIGSERAESKPLGEAAAKKQQALKAIRVEEAHEEENKALVQELESWEAACQAKEKALQQKKGEAAGQIVALLQQMETEKKAAEAVAASMPETYENRNNHISKENIDRDRTLLYRKIENYRALYQERAAFLMRVQSLRPDPDLVEWVARYQHITDDDLQRIGELERHLAAASHEEPESRLQRDDKVTTWSGWQMLTAVVLFIGGAILSYAGQWTISVTAVVAGVLWLIACRVYNRNREGNQIASDRRQKVNTNDIIEQWEAELIKLLERLDADTPRQARTRWQQVLQARERLAGSEQQVIWASNEAKKAEHRLSVLLTEIRDLLRESGFVDSACLEFPLDTEPQVLEKAMEQWETGAGEWQKRTQSADRLEQIRQEIIRWQKRLEELQVDADQIELPATPFTLQQLDDTLRALEQEERLYLVDYAKRKELEGRVRALRQGRAKIGDLTRELDYWREQEDRLMRQREALQIAKEAFDEIRTALYQEQAPRLLEKVSALAGTFTGGKYRQLRVDKLMEIRILSPDSGYTYEMGGLSKGTIDQLSFALSLAVAESVLEDGDKLPLLIDEPFLHYDDDRLLYTLEYLLSKSNQRQILFFTHRNADVEMLQRLSSRQVVVHYL